MSPAYCLLAAARPGPSSSSRGAIRQLPWSSLPSRAAKQASESKRGRHSQSTDPAALISAADCMSPTTA